VRARVTMLVIHTCSFTKKLSDATQHAVIDKIQSLCTKISTKVNVNNNACITF